MKIIILFPILIILNSCATYIDKGRNIQSDKIDFFYSKDFNEFIFKSKINWSADTETYITTNFLIQLPKGIVNWKIENNEFYFKYGDGQIIYINSGYINKRKKSVWTIKDVSDEAISDLIKEYEHRAYFFKVKRKNRISKIYTDGTVSIFLFNIKKDRIDDFIYHIKQFKYLN